MTLFKVTRSFPPSGVSHPKLGLGVGKPQVCQGPWDLQPCSWLPGTGSLQVLPFPGSPSLPIQRSAKACKKLQPFIMGQFPPEMFPSSAESLPGDLVTSCSQPTQWAWAEQCRVGKTSRLSIGSHPPGTPPHGSQSGGGREGCRGRQEDAKAAVEEGRGVEAGPNFPILAAF